MTAPTGSTDAPAGAVRLVFEYEGDTVRLVLQQPVDVAVTGFDLQQVQAPGHYVEVRGSDGRALSRVPVRAAFATSAEVFGEPGEPITRVEVEHPSGAFTVVVPAAEAAARIALLRVEAEPTRTPTPTPGVPGPDARPTPTLRAVELLDVALDR